MEPETIEDVDLDDETEPFAIEVSSHVLLEQNIKNKKTKTHYLIWILASICIIIVAVFVLMFFLVFKKKSNNSSSKYSSCS